MFLEKEGCHNMDHIRIEPKRMLGIGRVTQLNPSETSENHTSPAGNMGDTTEENGAFFFEEDSNTKFFDILHIHMLYNPTA